MQLIGLLVRVLYFSEMNEWHKYPFVRLLTSFVAGLLLSEAIEDYRMQWVYLVLSLAVLLIAGALLLHQHLNYRNRRFFGVIVLLLFVLMGFGWHQSYHIKHQKSHFSSRAYRHNAIFGVLNQTPVEKANSFKSVIKIESLLDTAGKAIPAKGKILAYFSKSSFIAEASYGDKIVFSGFIQPISKNTNPGAFDYAGYLEQRQIYHRIYLNEGDFRLVANNPKTIHAVAERLRNQLTNILQNQSLDKENFALISALVLGYDQYLSDDIREWYSNAGAMHILCVSGLHVGIIYLVMNFLMKFWKVRSRRWSAVKILFVIFSIWIYAMITGLEPAVMRASVMFTMVALGKLLQRKSRIYNTLAASAFLMLWINPDMLFWVGFQMSYMAVFGIVWLQPEISKWWRPSNKLLQYLWDLIAVSLAAQLILFPLLLFYFHKISLVFFITNIFAIPMATVVIYLTLLLLVLSWWPWLVQIIAVLLNTWTGWLNLLMELVSQLPLAYVDSIWISDWNVLLIYVALFFIAGALMQNRKYLLPSFLIIVIVVFVVLTDNKYQKMTNNRFILYHIKQSLAMDFMRGSSSVFIADSVLLNDKKKLGFQVENSWKSSFVDPSVYSFKNIGKVNKEYFSSREQFCLFNGDIYFILSKMPKVKALQKIEIDYLVIRGKPWIVPGKINRIFTIRKQVLISGSTPAWLSEKWESEFRKLGVSCYSTHESGAFVIDYHQDESARKSLVNF